jgi:hypothetical protein
LSERLEDAQQFAGQDFCFGTGQITAAIFGSIHEERYAKLKAEREKLQLETSILKADYLPRIELERVFAQLAEAIIQIIKTSAGSFRFSRNRGQPSTRMVVKRSRMPQDRF